MEQGAPSFPFFTHRDCPYFPCHEGADLDTFNCAFCYCPLYALGPACGGDFRYNDKGLKDCTGCTKPHEGDAGIRMVKERFRDLAALAAMPTPESEPKPVEKPAFEHYLQVGKKNMRCGYTTGTCAAAAARGAAELLLAGTALPGVRILTPAGIEVPVELEEYSSGDGWAQCAVRKDAGDDPDVTDGLLVFARVCRTDGPGVDIDGGEGVGRVTRGGLDQPVGAAAINHVPREMIAEQVSEAASSNGYVGGLRVEIFVPGGAEVARRTFNPRLGIEGGISILGTSGIVRPMSEQAIVDTIRTEMNVRRAEGATHLLVMPGNYGRDYAEGELGLNVDEAVQCSNYIGEALDIASSLGFETLLLVGHIGKLAKVSAGNMNTHSRTSDARAEVLAAHGALAGASCDAVAAIMQSITTDEALAILQDEGVLEPAMASLTQRLGERLQQRAGDNLQVECIVFSLAHGLLGKTPGADGLLRVEGIAGS